MAGSVIFHDELSEWSEQIATLYQAAYPDKAPDEAKLLIRLMQSPACFGVVASIDGQGTAFILLLQSGEEADILEVCVDPAYQGQGLGTKLMDRAISLSVQRKIVQICLEVASDNKAAIQLYQQAAFVQISTRYGYYKRAHTTMDALIMKKSLTPNSPSKA